MQPSSVEEIRVALAAAQDAARQRAFDSCDIDDIEELILRVDAELRTLRPNIQTLATYLNSLARSLRADAANRSVCLQIDSAMRNAGVPTYWDH